MKIILVGPGASGKDFLMSKLISSDMKYKPKTTTRPMRENELEGREYYFIENEKFESYDTNYFIVKQNFNINGVIWNYGLSRESFEYSDVMIMTPAEIKQLTKEDRAKCKIYYLNIPEDIRRKRISSRTDADSVERRLQSDRLDFEGYNDFDVEITDSSDIYKYFNI